MHLPPFAHRLLTALVLGSAVLGAGAAEAGPRRCAAARAAARPDVESRACRKSEPDAADPSTKADPAAKADPSAKADEKPRRVRSGAHLEVLARDLRLTDTSRGRLERIAARFHKATRRRLVVTGGTRTPQRQAELMFEKLAHREDLVALYENRAAVQEVLAAYREAQGRGLHKKALIHALRTTIEAQIARGVYVSKHLKSGAADVRSRDMTPAREEAFRAAVAEEPGVTLLDERRAAEPHLHLSL